MKIVSFIEPTQSDVIDAILTHCGLADEPARAPPPKIRELQYGTDLEFVQDPGPIPRGREHWIISCGSWSSPAPVVVQG